MPEPVTPAPAAAPATEPPPPTTPPATPPPETPPAAPPMDPMLGSLLEGLALSVGEPPAPPKPVEPPRASRNVAEVVKEEQAAAAAPATRETPPAEPPPAAPPGTPPAASSTPPPTPTQPAPPATPPPVEVEKRPNTKQIVEQTVQKTLEQLQSKTAPPAAAAPPPPPAKDPFEDQLSDVEREELAFARWVSEKDPNRKDFATKTLAYLKKTHEYVEKALTENPERKFDESDEDWQKWRRQNAPALSPVERRKLERAHIEESVLTKAREEQETRLAEIQRQTKALELKPVIEQEAATHASKIEQQLADDEIAGAVLNRVKEVGWEKTLQEDRVFAPAVRQLQDHSVQLATEFKLIMAGVKAPDAQNPTHQWLWNFMQANYQHYATSEQLRVRDGKTFLPRPQYFELAQKDPAAAQRHFTISEDEFLDLLASNTQQNIRKIVKTRDEELKASGYERKSRPTPPAQVPKTETPPATQAPTAAPAPPPAQPHVSPRATVTSAPGAAKTTPATQHNAATEVLKTLGVLPAT